MLTWGTWCNSQWIHNELCYLVVTTFWERLSTITAHLTLKEVIYMIDHHSGVHGVNDLSIQNRDHHLWVDGWRRLISLSLDTIGSTTPFSMPGKLLSENYRLFGRTHFRSQGRGKLKKIVRKLCRWERNIITTASRTSTKRIISAKVQRRTRNNKRASNDCTKKLSDFVLCLPKGY